jgi:hypothetical protein
MTRVRARRAFVSSSTRGRLYMDFFCLSESGIRVGYASPKLLRSLSRSERARVGGKAVLVLTANHDYSLRGVRPGAKLSAVARTLHVGKGYKVGLNTWYLAPNGSSRGVLKVRHNQVQEIGIADKRLTSTRASARHLLESFSNG